MKIRVYCSRFGEDKQQALIMIKHKFMDYLISGPEYKNGYYLLDIKYEKKEDTKALS